MDQRGKAVAEVGIACHRRPPSIPPVKQRQVGTAKETGRDGSDVLVSGLERAAIHKRR
jgi:hypothetical protein